MVLFEKYLTEFLDGERKKYSMPGYDCSVYHHGQEIYRHMVGYADLETRQPITRDTIYYVFSNTKVITCAAALQLYERGKFLLEDNIERFFPELGKMKVKTKHGIKAAERFITIRDLFCMTSGFGSGTISEEMGRQIYMEHGDCLRPIDMPKYLSQIPLEFEPGTQYLYGISHELLAALIEKITGERFSEYLGNHKFKPLGMKNTGFYPEQMESKERATLYRYKGPDEELVSYGLDSGIIPPLLKESASGGLITTVDDYMLFQEALCKGEAVLRRSTIELMRLNHLNAEQRKGFSETNIGMGYGLGVRTIINQTECGSPTGFGPFGWSGAAGSYGSIDPENELSIYYVQHMLDTDMGRTHNILRNIIYSFLA